jgi:excisionase family DNA binding protein
VPTAREVEPADLLTIREAAEMLGVSVPTLRRWDASGKFRARRHPINGYRMYARKDVLRLRARIVCEAR